MKNLVLFSLVLTLSVSAFELKLKDCSKSELFKIVGDYRPSVGYFVYTTGYLAGKVQLGYSTACNGCRTTYSKKDSSPEYRMYTSRCTRRRCRTMIDPVSKAKSSLRGLTIGIVEENIENGKLVAMKDLGNEVKLEGKSGGWVLLEVIRPKKM